MAFRFLVAPNATTNPVATNLDAHISYGGKTPVLYPGGVSLPSADVVAGALFGKAFTQSPTIIGNGGISYPGRLNAPQTRNFAVWIRWQNGYSGVASGGDPALCSLFSAGSGSPGPMGLSINHRGTSGDLVIQLNNNLGQNILAANTVMFAGVSITLNSFTDLVVKCNLDGANGNIRPYLNGAPGTALNPLSGRSWPNPITNNLISLIQLGLSTSFVVQHRTVAFGIWNLDEGDLDATLFTGGASTPIALPAFFDGLPDISANNIRNGIQHYWFGSSRLGVLALPSANSVNNGVGFGANGSEFTGNVVKPTAAQVLDGIGFGSGGNEFTGNRTDAPINKTVSGTSYGAGGNGFSGNVVLPAVGKVEYLTGYGSNSNEFVGTKTNAPANKVVNGIQFGAGGTEFTGNVVLPPAGDVDVGVGFGANGTEFTGNNVKPTAAEVANGIGFGSNGNEFTGNRTDAPQADTRLGVHFGPNGNGFTGQLVALGATTHVDKKDMRKGILFQYDGGAIETGELETFPVGDQIGGSVDDDEDLTGFVEE